jgi:hypothetical protein
MSLPSYLLSPIEFAAHRLARWIRSGSRCLADRDSPCRFVGTVFFCEYSWVVHMFPVGDHPGTYWMVGTTVDGNILKFLDSRRQPLVLPGVLCGGVQVECWWDVVGREQWSELSELRRGPVTGAAICSSGSGRH